ncbi:elongation factor Ts, mitochondrial isoform X1 [Aquila chrysaetos chrysaetos]|uniref:elongation factor Ts, mitochondrial isoform X1 n=1 Tax=Aquila chrysaetos chrysaetos TaxID=223781 RepID=UPI001B7D37C4|nr:elongation factor Ts, mitochondrial isoform X1 [Aquila chrysaetos chrysaetos]
MQRAALSAVCGAARAPPVRFFRAPPPVLAADKEALLQLRRRTGLPFLQCREALRRCGGDLGQAEAWLEEQAQRQGWSKATEVGGRRTPEGLVGLLREGTAAVMVEVNCETDFVARNAEFQRLVEQVALGTMAHCRAAATPPASCSKHLLQPDELAQLRTEPGGALLSDHLALAIEKHWPHRSDGLGTSRSEKPPPSSLVIPGKKPGASFPPSEPPGLAFPKNPPGSADTDPVRPAPPRGNGGAGGSFPALSGADVPPAVPAASRHDHATVSRAPGCPDADGVVTCRILRRDLRRRPRGKFNSSPKETPTDLGFLGINQPKWDLSAPKRGAGITGGFWPFPCSCRHRGGVFRGNAGKGSC